MPLTRHLYREDEVRAALIWCILQRRIIEAAFWATEMDESGCDYTTEVAKAWTYDIGVAGLGFLGKLDGTVNTVVALSRWQPRDASVVAILGSKPSITGAPDIPPGKWTPEEVYALRAMMQGRAGAAYATRDTWDWSLWHTAMDFKHDRTFQIESCCEAKAIAVAIVCQPSGSAIVTEPSYEYPIEVVNAIADWTADANIRSRRAYSIPVECLSHLTTRGKIDCYTSTDAEIRDLKRLERTLEKSPLWSEAITLARTSDDEYEDFYESYFNDIPDEWSLEDRAKSHGTGVNPCDLARFLYRWFGKMPCAAIWNGIKRAELEGTGFAFKNRHPTLPSLRPARRIIRPSHLPLLNFSASR